MQTNTEIMTEIRAPDGSVIPPLAGCGNFDLEEILPVSAIRVHTKTDDVPHVTDDQLRFYRDVAFENAEQYTSMFIRGIRQITEPLPSRFGSSFTRKNTTKFKLKYNSTDGLVYIYGGSQGLNNQTVMILPNTRTVRINFSVPLIDLTPCCGPCSNNPSMGYVLYRAGFSCAKDIPKGIILGVLKLISWFVSNPGDEVMTVRNQSSSRNDTGIVGTNNGAWASGAIELWRQYVPDAA